MKIDTPEICIKTQDYRTGIANLFLGRIICWIYMYRKLTNILNIMGRCYFGEKDERKTR